MDAEQIRAAMARKTVSVREFARRKHVDAAHAARILRGVRRPSVSLLDAMADKLGLTDDDERIAHVTERPGQLDIAAVRALADALAALRRADDVVGPHPLLPAAEAHRASLLRLLRDARGRHRAALAAVVSEAAQFCGWLNIELGDHDRAVIVLNQAIEIANDINDGSLAAQALNLRGNVARRRGDWAAVHQWFLGAYTAESYRRQRVVNGAQAASALATLGWRRESEALLRECESLREKATESPPTTAYWLTPEWMLLPLGHVHLSLGRHQQASEHLKTGLLSLPPENRYALWTSEARAALAEAEGGEGPVTL